MIRAVDHLVIACADPDRAAAALEAQVGLESTGGGEHPSAGTHNRLAFLADGSYLELIGVADPTAARGHPIGAATLRALEADGGLATFALFDDDVAASCAAVPSLHGPVHGSRRRSDGELVEWWTAVPSVALAPTMPFLIQHMYAGAEWGPEALRARAEYVHPVGSPVQLRRLDLAVDDPPAAAAQLAVTFGVPVPVTHDLDVLTFGPHTVRLVARAFMPEAAAVVLGADVGAAVTADLLGIRFIVEPLARSA